MVGDRSVHYRTVDMDRVVLSLETIMEDINVAKMAEKVSIT